MNWSVLAALVFAFALNVPAASPAKSAECLTCHDDKGAAFKNSVHGSFSCTDCHATISQYPHPATVAKVKCDTCHNDPVSGVKASVHASVSAQPCQGCHGDAHTILPASDARSSTYPSNLPRTCGTCHGDPKLAREHKLSEVYSLYMDSIHGFALTKDGLLVAASCSSCHGSHKILSKTDPASRTNRANVANTCGKCHGGPMKDYLAGIHGQRMSTGDASAPVCTNCHTAHQIADPRTPAWQTKTTATCGGCHQEKLATYRDTFHAQVSALGYVETAHCWDCHGFHDIRPATDRKSTIARANLEATCGKCHSGVTKSFVSYQPHADRHNRQAYPALWASSVFMNMLLAGVLGFFALHTFLWLMRSLAERRKGGPVEGEIQ
jgi:5-methylcytosine-specific restriction endonuclease McrA